MALRPLSSRFRFVSFRVVSLQATQDDPTPRSRWQEAIHKPLLIVGSLSVAVLSVDGLSPGCLAALVLAVVPGTLRQLVGCRSQAYWPRD
jgi:hypothetical protein